VRDPDGSRWLSVADAAREQRVNIDTVRKWARRGKVRTHTILGRVYVCVDDVADAELAWRARHAGQPAPECPH
jgi:predicted site-specific integrase-resolvase